MNDISIRNITATGCGDWGCAFLGLPDNPIKGLQLHNINITFPGGGSEEDSQRIVEEKPLAYPQPIHWGKLPVYGMFVRNADKVSLQNIDLRATEQDQRSPLWLENINGLILSGVKTQTAVVKQPQVIRKNVIN